MPVSADQPRAAASRPGSLASSNRPILLERGSDDELPDTDEDELEEEDDSDLRDVIRNAPAWLVSTVFHMLLLIVLGLLAFSSRSKSTDLQVEMSYTEGSQLEDPSVLDDMSTALETMPEQIITPPDLKPIDDPLAAPPELVALDVPLTPTTPAMTTKIVGAPVGLALKGREAGSRQALLRKYGGTDATEAAVEAGLAWLAKQQLSNGSWSLKGPFADGAQSENVPAATAMALLAFQGHGDTHLEGKYASTVAKGSKALRGMQRADGLFTGKIELDNQMLYAHAQGTIALCELYGMTGEDSLRPPAERAIKFCLEAQDPEHGGWRYRPRSESDTSVTGWFVMALQSPHGQVGGALRRAQAGRRLSRFGAN